MVSGSATHSKHSGPGLTINLSSCKYEILHEVASQLGYRVQPHDEGQVEETGWDLCWSDLSVSMERVSCLRPFQLLNHFPGMLDICRKAALTRHMTRMAMRCPEEYGFYPKSFLLPEQSDDLMAALKHSKHKEEQGQHALPTWIIKPSAGTMGRGITLLQTAAQLRNCDLDNSIAQEYISNPLLLDGLKFDLRMYALVVSVDPLRVYLFDEGLARLATTAYERPASSNLNNKYMHLTNYAINKNAPGFTSSDETARGTGAHKRLSSAVLQRVADEHGTSKATLTKAAALRHGHYTSAHGLSWTAYMQPHSALPFLTSLIKCVIQPLQVPKLPTAFTLCSDLQDTHENHDSYAYIMKHLPIGTDTCFELMASMAIAEVIVKTILCIQPRLAHTYHTAITAGGFKRESCDRGGYDHGDLSTTATPCSADRHDTNKVAANGVIPRPRCGCPKSQCFEILGFDILLDDKLQPKVLEVNHSPSFNCESKLDHAVKSALIYGTIQALSQTLEGRTEWLQQQERARAERLYAPCQQRRPRSANLQATAKELDRLVAESRPSRRHGAMKLDRQSSGTASNLGSGKQHVSYIGIEGSSGLWPTLEDGLGETTERVGLFTLIYPPPDRATRLRYARVLCSAADTFPDQRCQCAYCQRRTRIRILQASLQRIAWGKQPQAPLAKPAPLVNTVDVGTHTDQCVPCRSSSVSGTARPSDACLRRRLSLSPTTEQHSASLFRAQFEPPVRHPQTMPRHSPSGSDCSNTPRVSRQSFRPYSASGTIPNQPSVMNASSLSPTLAGSHSTGTQLDSRELCSAYGRSAISSSAAPATDAVRELLSQSRQPTSAQDTQHASRRPPLVPRIASLTRTTKLQQTLNSMDVQLMAMRMQTAVMLENPFVSFRIHDKQDSVSKLGNGHPQGLQPTKMRAQSAR